MTRVVLLHGFLGSPAAWDAVREVLETRRSADLEIVAPWLPGHGSAAAPLAELGWDAAIDGFVRDVGAAPAVWVGYSMGARIALGVAARSPASVRGLMLVSGHLGLATEADRARRAADDDAFARLADAGMEAMVDAHASRSVLIAQNALPACLREMLRARRLSHEPHAIGASIRALGLGAMPDLRGVLGAFAGRLDVVAGGDDPIYAALAREAAKLGGTEPVVVPSVGHDVVLEDPESVAEAVLRAIAREEDATAAATSGMETGVERGTKPVAESHP